MRVGEWDLDISRGTLQRGSSTKQLTPKALQVLRVLVDNPDQLVTTERLREDFWRGPLSADNAVSKTISELRRAFGDKHDKSQYIQTVAKRGYILIADVEVESGSTNVESIEVALNPSPYRLLDEVTVQSLGILPFANRGSDVEYDHFCDGMAEELIVGLSKIEGIRVASQLNSFGFKGSEQSLQEIGEILVVDHVLTGSVQIMDSRVRVTVALSIISGGTVLWSERFDGTLDSVFEFQEQVAVKVVQSLQAGWVHEPDFKIIDAGTRNPRAYNSFLKGLFEFYKTSARGFRRSHEHFAEALKLDPTFARVHWQDLVSWYVQKNHQLVAAEQYYAEVKRCAAALRQLGFEPRLPEAWLQRMIGETTWPDEKTLAFEAVAEAQIVGKNYSGFEFDLIGRSLVVAGLFEGGLEYWRYYFKQAENAEFHTGIFDQYRALLTRLGMFEEAITFLNQRIKASPETIHNYGYRSMLYSRLGRFDESRQDLDLLGESFPISFMLFYDHYWQGDMPNAKRLLLELRQRKGWSSNQEVWSAFMMGDLEAGFDRMDQASTTAFDRRVLMPSLLSPENAELVLSHPRYDAYFAQQGLDQAWQVELCSLVNELEPQTGILVAQ